VKVVVVTRPVPEADPTELVSAGMTSARNVIAAPVLLYWGRTFGAGLVGFRSEIRILQYNYKIRIYMATRKAF
jgi:hypothetical protein